MQAKELRQAIDTAVGLAMVAYIAYAKITGDNDLRRLKAQIKYRWYKLTRKVIESSDPAWKQELREFVREDGGLRDQQIVLPEWNAVE